MKLTNTQKQYTVVLCLGYNRILHGRSFLDHVSVAANFKQGICEFLLQFYYCSEQYFKFFISTIIRHPSPVLKQQCSRNCGGKYLKAGLVSPFYGKC